MRSVAAYGDGAAPLVPATVLGVQVWSAMSTELVVLLVAAGAAFSWRAYGSTTPFGWV